MDLAGKQVLKLNSVILPKIKLLYSDFVKRACRDYHFELPPIEFKDFSECVSQDLVEGFVLFENETPVAFLLYTTTVNEAVELNLIHVIDNVNLQERRKELLEYFLKKLNENNNKKTISYPMLGIQDDFTPYITNFGFKSVGQAVVKFNFDNHDQLKTLKSFNSVELPDEYSLSGWNDDFYDDVIKLIHNAFKDMSDAKFDPRFKSVEGCKDIVDKIVQNIYGEFLGDATSVLLYKKMPVGICFVNLTNSNTANIPLIGILDEHKQHGFGSLLMKNSLLKLLNKISAKKLKVFEINASVDKDNYPAMKSYKNVGFEEDYSYTHAYL